jgi:hypothetical protein
VTKSNVIKYYDVDNTLKQKRKELKKHPKSVFRQPPYQLSALSPAIRVQWIRDCCPAPRPITCPSLA